MAKAYCDYDITFNTVGDAFLAKKDLLITANAYGSASLAEFKNVLNLASTYEDNKIRWSAKGIAGAHIRPNEFGTWSIMFPVHSETCEKVDTLKEDVDDDEYELPRPVYVNITTADMGSPADILDTVFNCVDELWNRDTFINIF